VRKARVVLSSSGHSQGQPQGKIIQRGKLPADDHAIELGHIHDVRRHAAVVVDLRAGQSEWKAVARHTASERLSIAISQCVAPRRLVAW
jgi:hypothetical protein